MRRLLLFLVLYFLFFVAFSLVGKCIFAAYEWQLVSKVPFLEVVEALGIGLRHDMSFSGYVCVGAILFCLLTFWNTRLLTSALSWYTTVLISILSLLVVSDAELYRNWLSHIDATVFQYLKTPAEAMASTPTWLILLLLAWSAIIAIFFARLYRRLSSIFLEKIENVSWYFIPVGIASMALLFLPIRGSLSVAPINTGTVFFSTNPVSNHLAVNPAWNFIYSMGKLDVLSNEYVYMDDKKALAVFNDLQHEGIQRETYLNTCKPNVIIIMMESFSAHITDCLGHRKNITPRFDSLVSEGILFQNMTAASYRTDKGLVAILCGYPAQPLNSIIKFPEKTQNLSFLSKELSNIGYQTFFVYGGDKNFSNINSLLLNGGIRHIIDEPFYDGKIDRTKWGVADEFLMSKGLELLDTCHEPFFSLMVTQSSHEPYEFPGKHRFAGNADSTEYFNSAFYADSCLGGFIEKAREKPWWNNTLVIIVADHCSRLPDNFQNTDPRRYHIPMLWIGGALKQKNIRINTRCNQTDIARTLLIQMGKDRPAFRFSRNIFDMQEKHYGFFVFYDGFGFVTDSTQQVFNNETRSFVPVNGNPPPGDSLWGKALWQVANEDFLKK